MLPRGFLDMTVFVHLEEVEDNIIIFYPTTHTLIGHLLRLRRHGMACLSFCTPHHHVLIKWTRGQYQDAVVLLELYSAHKPPPSRHLHCNLHAYLIWWCWDNSLLITYYCKKELNYDTVRGINFCPANDSFEKGVREHEFFCDCTLSLSLSSYWNIRRKKVQPIISTHFLRVMILLN